MRACNLIPVKTNFFRMKLIDIIFAEKKKTNALAEIVTQRKNHKQCLVLVDGHEIENK